MNYYITVFQDPSISTITTANVSNVATDCGCTASSYVVSGSRAAIERFHNMAIRWGWPVSVIRAS